MHETKYSVTVIFYSIILKILIKSLKLYLLKSNISMCDCTKPSTIDQNKRVMFIPASSIAKFKSSVDANNITNKILSLPETLDSLPLCKIDVNIANKLMDESVDIVLPKLSSFELNSLNFKIS